MAKDTALPVGSPWQYIPSLGGNLAIALISAAYCVIFILYLFRRSSSKRSWWILPFGLFWSALGFVIRTASRTDASLKGIPLYAVQNLFVILSPAAYLAFNYILFGRLLVALDPSVDASLDKRRTKSKYSLIPPRLVSRIFVWSDVITFLIQCSGGGLQASGGSSSVLGNKIFLAGVALQAASYILYLVLVTSTHYKLAQESSRYSLSYVFSNDPTVRILICIYFSSIWIVIRSIYRIVEMAQGYGGMLYSTEAYLFALDAAPLLLATGIWVLQWPVPLVESVHAARRAELPSHTASTSLMQTYSEKSNSADANQATKMGGPAGFSDYDGYQAPIADARGPRADGYSRRQ